MNPRHPWLWAIAALIGAPALWAAEAGVDPLAAAPGGDIAPVLSLVDPATRRDDRTVYGQEEIWCALGYCPPPTPRGISAKPKPPPPVVRTNGFSIPLRPEE